MPLDSHRVDLILQYVLLAAGEEDDHFDRQLGPIHLIKYVYLADLAYARTHNGESYTGVNWQFYKFGPWSSTVNERIEPALLAIRAIREIFPSDYEDKSDWVRWSIRDERLLDEKQQELPPIISLRLRSNIHKYGKDTPNLLDYVYRTKPMLSAAPNEYLDLSLELDSSHDNKVKPQELRFGSLSAKKKKKFADQMRMLREKQISREPKRLKLINPVKNTRYDNVYEEGLTWLDKLAGDQLTPGEKKVEFSDEVWKSSTRKGEDVS